MKTWKKLMLTAFTTVVSLSVTAQEYSTADRGFRHPGGLHTQADFDRVKQQLKEGNERVTAAYNVLKNAAYSSASAATYPAETIVRGGSGENYINAARGATIAYQNALRWKIDGTEENAKHAVQVLMKWCNTTKAVSGTSDQCLARGLYGYQFAQAAELMRDYEGWSREDFKKFQQWMLDVWYPGCIGFLRGRNGTWENAGKWWQAPGHYWSNWGLCNALAVISIGVLCDDVFIYNQGMSFIKYDQVGTFKDPRTANPILNDGLAEFWGNLVVTTTEWAQETGAYGKVGQMNESGRDTGHSAMALGLAVDIAQQGWNQGDDLFAYMDHRIAAGIEYVAAQTQSVAGLPWTNYHYASSGYYYSDSRSNLMTGPALGAQMRPYWGTVIGHYEGVKGVRMPFSEVSYENMGIDAGGQGGTSGGYDHLGYSVLMNTRTPQLAPADQVPTELTPQMTYGSKTVKHNELGGLTNTYQATAYKNRALAPGTVVTLSPQLPKGETDTGKWRWNTGETTRELTITANRSYLYRVTYTNANGIESEQSYAIAVLGDCRPSTLRPSVTYDGTTTVTNEVEVLKGASVTLGVTDAAGLGNYQWSNGKTTASITLTGVKEAQDVECHYFNQGGGESIMTFHITVADMRPDIILNGTTLRDTLTLVARAGDKVVLAPAVHSSRSDGVWLWDTGSNKSSLTFESIESSELHTVTYTFDGQETRYDYRIYVKEAKDRLVDVGYYTIRHRESGRYLTREGDLTVLDSEKLRAADDEPDDTQVWYLDRASTATYDLISAVDNAYMKRIGGVQARKAYRPHRIMFAAGTDYCQFYSKVTSGTYYWAVGADGALQFESTSQLENYPFELIRVSDYIPTGIESVELDDENLGDEWLGAGDGEIYDLTGRRLASLPDKGFYIKGGKKYLKK